MPVRVNIDKEKIVNNIGRAWDKGLAMLSTQILKSCNLYCKEDTGMLIISSYTHSDFKKGRLIWRTPYAARQYYEIQTAYKDVNPNATWRWVEVAKKNHYSEWTMQAQAIVRLYK